MVTQLLDVAAVGNMGGLPSLCEGRCMLARGTALVMIIYGG